MRFTADFGLWPLTLRYYYGKLGWAGRWLCCYNTSCGRLPPPSGVTVLQICPAASHICSVSNFTMITTQAGHWSAQRNGRAIILGKALLLPLENTKSQNYGNGMYGFQQTRPLSLLWFPGCEVNSNLIFVGDAVLHSALAVEKLGNGQNRSINNGFGPRNNFVSKTIWTYLFSFIQHWTFFSVSRKEGKRRKCLLTIFTRIWKIIIFGPTNIFSVNSSDS